MPVTEEEFNNLNDLLNDPLLSSELTLNELDEIDGLLTSFQEERASGRAKLVGEGFSDQQIADLESSKAEETTSGAQQRSALGPSVLPTGRTVAGVQEGATKAVEGVFDLAKDISVGLGIEDEESRQQWKQSLNQDRMQRRTEHLQEFGQLPSGSSEFLGEVAPWIAALPASAESFTATLLKRAMQGAAIGGSTVQAKEDTFIDRAGGIALGSGIGAATSVMSIWPAFKKSAARGFARSYNQETAAQAERVEELVQIMSGNPEFAFSLAQTTANRAVFALELNSAGAATKAQQNKNIQILVTNILKTSKQMAGEGRSAGQIAGSLRSTMKKARKDIYDGASSDWRVGTEALLAKHGDDVVVRGKTYLDKIDRMIAEAEDGLAGVGGRAGTELRAYRETVDEIVNPAIIQETDDGFRVLNRATGEVSASTPDSRALEAVVAQMNEAAGISSDQTLRIMKGLNKLIGGDVVIFENASVGSNRSTGRALMGTFTDELEHGATNPTAARDLQGIRDAYKEQMARAQAIDDTVVASAFGGKNLPKEPGKRLDAILKSEKEDLVAVREFLEEWNPQLLDDLRATHLERIVKGAAKPGTPATDLQTTISGLEKRLASQFGRAGQSGKGLHTAAQQADLLKTAKALRILNNKYIKGIAPGGVRVDDLAINLISRSPEFMARFVTRALTGGKSLERILLDPSARTALQALATQPLEGRAGKAAMVFMAMFINSQDNARQSKEQEEANRLLGQK